MPWKGEKDPYKIWLSEIILQQTRVEQGLNYYEKFLKNFPNVHLLAQASEKKVFKLWEGLGYYSRCRNLIATAKSISKNRAGVFPGTYTELLQLKGVGEYTASAIASFAYNLPYAVVDGNVYRVLARVFGIEKPSDSSEGKKIFKSLAGEIIDKKQPGTYNQAIMDFGATICKPLAPICDQCGFKKYCYAFQHKKVVHLPTRTKKIQVKKRWINYLVIETKESILVRKRSQKDIWQNLYEFVSVETKSKTTLAEILKLAERNKFIRKKEYHHLSTSPVVTQKLTHQHISGIFYRILINKQRKISGYTWVPKKNIKRYPFPKFITGYLQNHHHT